MLKKSNIQKVLDILFQKPTEQYTIRQLARKTNMSPPTALLIVRKLKHEGILQERTVGRASQVCANTESEKYRRKKRIHNLESLYTSELVEYITKLYHDPQAIILFGSYSRGEDTEQSDIDIAVITAGHKDLDLQSCEKKLFRKISIHEIQIDKISEEFKNNLYNGILLKGAL